METPGTFFVAKKQQDTKTNLSWIYILKGKTMVSDNYTLLLSDYTDKEKQRTRRAKHFLLLLKPKKLFISSVYSDVWGFAFDYKEIYYKMKIDTVGKKVEIKKYNVME